MTRSQMEFAFGLANGGAQDCEAQRPDRIVQVLRKDAVSIMDQIPVLVGVRDYLNRSRF